MVLFGAPVTSHFPHTALCAAHIALLVAFPLVYANGVDGRRWRDAVAVAMPMDGAFGGALGALLGAWLGAVPIPLGLSCLAAFGCWGLANLLVGRLVSCCSPCGCFSPANDIFLLAGGIEPLTDLLCCRDREWQKWPVTILTGAYIGYLVGKSLGSTFHGKKLPF